MKLSMEQAAHVVGKTKKTIYNHKDANKFSWETDNDGKAVIDVSELMRVYGNDHPIPERLEELQNGSSVKKNENTPNYTPKKETPKANFTSEEYEEYLTLKISAGFKDEQIEALKADKEKWEKLATSVTRLIEHQESEAKQQPQWDKTFKALEQRLANQERAAKERDEREQKLLDENERIKKAYRKQKKALEDEKNKPWYKKLFAAEAG